MKKKKKKEGLLEWHKCLPGKFKVLSLNHSTAKKKRKKEVTC
jgi:hypothetical protein